MWCDRRASPPPGARRRRLRQRQVESPPAQVHVLEGGAPGEPEPGEACFPGDVGKVEAAVVPQQKPVPGVGLVVAQVALGQEAGKPVADVGEEEIRGSVGVGITHGHAHPEAMARRDVYGLEVAAPEVAEDLDPSRVLCDDEVGSTVPVEVHEGGGEGVLIPAGRGMMGSVAPPDRKATRWEVIRDVSVFQVKLGLDALRDLLLSPISIVAALAGLVLRSDRPSVFFDEVIRLGRRSEHFIDLFGMQREPEAPQPHDGPTVDAIVARVQGALVEQYRKGGVTAGAKHQIDRALDVVERKPPTRIGPPPSDD